MVAGGVGLAPFATLAEALAARGHATAVFSGNPWVSAEYGFAQGVEHFVTAHDERFEHVTLFMRNLRHALLRIDLERRLYDAVHRIVLGDSSTTAGDTRLVDEAIRWLGANRARRFFAYVHLMSPHRPYDPPAPFDRFVGGNGRAVKNHPGKSFDFMDARADPLPDADLADMVARYDGDVLYADTEIGRLLHALDELGLAANTFVLVTADHGEEFYEHEVMDHGNTLYYPSVHVPLIVRYPGQLPEGVRVPEPVSIRDVLATIGALAGLPRGSIPGQSLARYWRTGMAGVHDTILSEVNFASGLPERYPVSKGRMRSAMLGWTRYILNGDQTEELYDLRADPGETQNVVSAPAYTTTLEELRRTVQGMKESDD